MIPIEGGLRDMPYPDTSWTIKKDGRSIANVWGINGIYGIQWLPQEYVSPFRLSIDAVIQAVRAEIGYQEKHCRG